MAALIRQDNKAVVWKRELPFTFWQACVNDDGIVGGCGYSKGPMGGDPLALGNDAGEFIVRVLDAKGTATYEETSRRGPAEGGYSGYVPPLSANQLLFDAENDRMIIRINDVFRNYHLGAGCLQSAVIPVVEKVTPDSIFCEESRLISGSPLLLVQLEHMRWETMIEGTVFGVMDMRGKMIWSVNHENKIREEGNVVIHGSVKYKILSISAVATPELPQERRTPIPIAQFDIFFGDSAERVTYSVSKVETERQAVWSVAEVKRVKWALPKDKEEGPPRNLPRANSKMLGEFPLLGSDNKPLTDIAAATLDPKEQIYALESTTGYVHVFDRGGKPLHLCKPGKEHRVETGWYDASLTVDDQGEVFVKLSKDLPGSKTEPEKPNPEGGHFLRFSAKGVLLGKFPPTSLTEIGEQWIAQPKSQSILTKARLGDLHLVRRDEYRSRIASLTHRADGHWLEYVSGVCFAPDGSIAVRDSSMGNEFGGFRTPFPLPSTHLPTETITLYKPDATPIRTIDFTAGGSLSRIAFDGSHIIATSDFDPPSPFVYVFKATGEVVGSFSIDRLVGKESISLDPFIVENGAAILVLDRSSGRVFRHVMPK